MVKRKKNKKTNNDLQNTTRNPLKDGGEHRCSGRVSSSWFKCGTHRVTLVTNPVISHEWGEDWTVIATNSISSRGFVFNRCHFVNDSQSLVYINVSLLSTRIEMKRWSRKTNPPFIKTGDSGTISKSCVTTREEAGTGLFSCSVYGIFYCDYDKQTEHILGHLWSSVMVKQFTMQIVKVAKW